MPRLDISDHPRRLAVFCLAIIVVGFIVELSGHRVFGTLVIAAAVITSLVLNLRRLRR